MSWIGFRTRRTLCPVLALYTIDVAIFVPHYHPYLSSISMTTHIFRQPFQHSCPQSQMQLRTASSHPCVKFGFGSVMATISVPSGLLRKRDKEKDKDKGKGKRRENEQERKRAVEREDDETTLKASASSKTPKKRNLRRVSQIRLRRRSFRLRPIHT
jgi:hypothetical protein